MLRSLVVALSQGDACYNLDLTQRLMTVESDVSSV